MTAVGVDACKKGWIAIALHHGRAPTGHFLRSLDALLDEMPDPEGIAIDIPIGLPARGRRQADIAARRALGPRGRSVFFTPVRPALTAATHAEATAVSRELTGKSVSQQAYRLAPKILEAERWSATHDIPVWEVHPARDGSRHEPADGDLGLGCRNVAVVAVVLGRKTRNHRVFCPSKSLAARGTPRPARRSVSGSGRGRGRGDARRVRHHA